MNALQPEHTEIQFAVPVRILCVQLDLFVEELFAQGEHWFALSAQALSVMHRLQQKLRH